MQHAGSPPLGNVGYGAALGVLLVVIMAVPLLLLFALMRRR
ncbi:MAG TPA: hypothetical protein VIE45_00720 [Streptosporangiaceae bacterium]|jgi:ABC-type spermidine/putrescine transport system permease subunit I